MTTVIILAMVFVFVALRLWSVLGRRTGHEQPIAKPETVAPRTAAVALVKTEAAAAQGGGQTARDQKICPVTGADLGVAITGIAGPGGGSEEKPVGTVYLALARAGRADDHLVHLGGDRWQIQEHASQIALDLLRRSLLASE